MSLSTHHRHDGRAGHHRGGAAQRPRPRAPGPRRPSAASASLTFAWRALLKIKHVPMQLFDVTAFPIMFVVLYTYLFGGALAGSTSEYLQALLPGILVMTVSMITIYTGMGLNTDIQKGVFDRFRSLPIWRPAVIVGMLIADAVRYIAASIVVLSLGVTLGFRPDGGPIGVVAAVALLLIFCFSLSWVWMLLGLKVQTPDTVMQISMTILFPLTFASNVFVDPATMPGWVQAFVKVNPITHLTDASRGLMHGTGARQLDRVGAAVVRRVLRGLRAADHARLQHGAVAGPWRRMARDSGHPKSELLAARCSGLRNQAPQERVTARCRARPGRLSPAGGPCGRGTGRRQTRAGGRRVTRRAPSSRTGRSWRAARRRRRAATPHRPWGDGRPR